jgi:hypothetical protein
MRCTEPTEMPVALAIARPVQCGVWCGGSVQVSATTRAVGLLRHKTRKPGKAPIAAETLQPPLRQSAVASATPSAD